MLKKNSLFLFVVVLALSFTGCFSFFESDPSLVVAPKEVVINLATMEEQSVSLIATVEDMVVEDDEILWEVDDNTIASLSAQTGSEVIVTGLAEGETTITVSYGDLEPVILPVTVNYNEVAVPLEILFAEMDYETFFSAEYASLPNIEEEPLFLQLAGWTSTDVADDVLCMEGGSRWSIGMPGAYGPEAGDDRKTTTKDDLETVGYLDLSEPYVITVEFANAVEDIEGIFQVFVDNNTVAEANSIHGVESQIYLVDTNEIESNQVVEIKSEVGTETSFLTFRVSGKREDNQVNIKSIMIDYQ